MCQPVNNDVCVKGDMLYVCVLLCKTTFEMKYRDRHVKGFAYSPRQTSVVISAPGRGSLSEYGSPMGHIAIIREGGRREVTVFLRRHCDDGLATIYSSKSSDSAS